MEAKQTAQMVAWLDEERRKDKALITKLEERTATQSTLIDDQARRIQTLEGELAAWRSKALTSALFDETIARLRTELIAYIEQSSERRPNNDQDFKRMLDVERESTSKALEAIRQEIQSRIEQATEPRRAEEERLSRVAVELQTYADNLSRGLEEFERSLAYLEEQRRHDSRRVSDMNSEMIEFSKRLEGITPKIELLEELSRRNERALGEVPGALLEIKQQQQEWSEQEASSIQQRDRAVTDMLRRFESFAEDMDGYGKQVDTWMQTHRQIKKQIEDFDRLADRVDRRLNEVAEVQRLAEDRFRHDWEGFLQDDQKRWRQFTLTNEEQWRISGKGLDDLRSQIAKLAEQIEQIAGGLKQTTVNQHNLLRVLANDLQALRDEAEELS